MYFPLGFYLAPVSLKTINASVAQSLVEWENLFSSGRMLEQEKVLGKENYEDHDRRKSTWLANVGTTFGRKRHPNL